MVNLITTTPIAQSVVKAKLVKVAELIRLDRSPIKMNKLVAHAYRGNISQFSTSYINQYPHFVSKVTEILCVLPGKVNFLPRKILAQTFYQPD